MLQSLSAAAKSLLPNKDAKGEQSEFAQWAQTRGPSAHKQGDGEAQTLKTSLNQVAELVANITEAYTAAIFVAREGGTYLELGGIHTLSRDVNHSVRIGAGNGLVGWVAQNKDRVSVFPFEHDARTLLYYRTDQELKSFVAVPVLGPNKVLYGVIACDSKRSYAFSKMAEKLLVNCADQVRTLVELHRRADIAQNDAAVDESKVLDRTLDNIRSQETEQALFAIACDLPEALVQRDALVVLALSEGGVGEGTFYSKSNQSTAGNRLLDIVCKHKRIICGDRSVHAQPVDDIKKRSFLSVPFHILGKEAGSFNLLSLPQTAFRAGEIASIEKIAKVFGRELERIRLKHHMTLVSEPLGISSWENFAIQAKLVLREAKERKHRATLLRLNFSCLVEIEETAGVLAAQSFLELAIRLIHQVKRNDAIASAIFGPEIFILTATDEADNTVRRFKTLLAKSAPQAVDCKLSNAALHWNSLVEKGIQISAATYPQQGDNINDLAAHTLRQKNNRNQQDQRTEERVNVRASR